MNTIKVTPEQLHYVSNQVDQARQQLESIRGELTRQIMFIRMMWTGATQEQFYYEFERSSPILNRALESMVQTSKELKDIATRFEDADAQKVSLGGAAGAVGVAAMMTNSSGTTSDDKGYRMAQVNMYGRLVWMPVNENGVTDQASLQAYQKDQGHLDFNQMQAVHVEPPGEDIYALQIEAFELGINPFSGEPVSENYAQLMVASLKVSQIFTGIQMVRGSIPGGKGKYRLPSNSKVVTDMKKNIEAAKAKRESTQKSVTEGTQKVTEQKIQLSQNLIDHVINRHSVNSTKQQLPYLQKKLSDEQINEMLSKKSFFNKEWSDKKITDASTEAVNQLKKQGIKEGLHTVTVFNEPIKVFIRNDNVDSVYGTHIYKISDLID
ncbi:WXG100 family type VII secretion target [Paenibacillus amylolyticus]|uniref:WXG100 family type VII secretion target n=1 Tax=Paenibacillus amylolyticus TaxID=1451 RepID=A0AAP5H0K4_PAEAM|nr:WXG100 family type VII secretion target [Paenibacillus amylolyticus]MDR6722771.1 WXG100 family type VII secretion target [Paenibacillus amylolyticus]